MVAENLAEEVAAPAKSVLSQRAYPTNPLGIISLFVFFIEAVSTVSLIQMSKATSPQVLNEIAPLVQFVIWFPVGIALAFFFVLWFKHKVLYAPGDYRNEEHFMEPLKRIEINQEATRLKNDADIELYRKTIKQLAKIGNIDLMINVGRKLLDAKRYEDALSIFYLIKDQSDKTAKDYYRVPANIGYCLIDLDRDYSKVVKLFLEVYNLIGNQFAAWHMLALAFAYKKTENETEYQNWLKLTKQHTDWAWWQEKAIELYPEIANDLN